MERRGGGGGGLYRNKQYIQYIYATSVETERGLGKAIAGQIEPCSIKEVVRSGGHWKGTPADGLNVESSKTDYLNLMLRRGTGTGFTYSYRRLG